MKISAILYIYILIICISKSKNAGNSNFKFYLSKNVYNKNKTRLYSKGNIMFYNNLYKDLFNKYNEDYCMHYKHLIENDFVFIVEDIKYINNFYQNSNNIFDVNLLSITPKINYNVISNDIIVNKNNSNNSTLINYTAIEFKTTHYCNDNIYNFGYSYITYNLYYNNTKIFIINNKCTKNFNNYRYKIISYINLIFVFLVITVLMYYMTRSNITICKNNQNTNHNNNGIPNFVNFNEFNIKEIFKLLVSGSLVLLLLFLIENIVNIIFGIIIAFTCFLSLRYTLLSIDSYYSNIVSIKLNKLLCNKQIMITSLNNSFKFNIFKNYKIIISNIKNDIFINEQTPMNIIYTLDLFNLIINIFNLLLLIAYFYTKHFVLNNLFSLFLAYCYIQNSPQFTNYRLVYIFMFVFCLFDLFWVYLSPFIFKTNIMVLAVQKLNYPIKLAFPNIQKYFIYSYYFILKHIINDYANINLDFIINNYISPYSNCMFVGLGDIVIPATSIIYLKRFSFLINDKKFYYFSLYCYFIALISAGIANLYFNYPQPAIFYLFIIQTHMIIIYCAFNKCVKLLFNPDSLELNVVNYLNLKKISNISVSIKDFNSYVDKDIFTNKNLSIDKKVINKDKVIFYLNYIIY